MYVYLCMYACMYNNYLTSNIIVQWFSDTTFVATDAILIKPGVHLIS